MSDDEQSTIQKLATMATKALDAAEAQIENALGNADEELLKGPSHIGSGQSDPFGLQPDHASDAVIPLVVDEDNNQEETSPPAKD